MALGPRRSSCQSSARQCPLPLLSVKDDQHLLRCYIYDFRAGDVLLHLPHHLHQAARVVSSIMSYSRNTHDQVACAYVIYDLLEWFVLKHDHRRQVTGYAKHGQHAK